MLSMAVYFNPLRGVKVWGRNLLSWGGFEVKVEVGHRFKSLVGLIRKVSFPMLCHVAGC